MCPRVLLLFVAVFCVVFRLFVYHMMVNKGEYIGVINSVRSPASPSCHHVTKPELQSNGSPSNIFVGLIVSRILYALPAWGVFASVGQSGRIDAFLKRAYKFGFSKDIITFNELLTKSGSSLFLKMQSSVHCLNYLLPPKKDHVLQT